MTEGCRCIAELLEAQERDLRRLLGGSPPSCSGSRHPLEVQHQRFWDSSMFKDHFLASHCEVRVQGAIACSPKSCPDFVDHVGVKGKGIFESCCLCHGGPCI